MSERIRSLEYAYRSSGEVSDLLAWIHARQRAGLLLAEAELEEGEESEEERLTRWVEAMAEGRLQPEQLELAAYLGDPLARLLDEERAISLATYLGEGLELVPLVLGEEARDEHVVGRWIRTLAHWSESWVVEAQLAIAEAWYRQFEGEVAASVREETPWEQGYWESARVSCREVLDAAWECLANLTHHTLRDLDATNLEWRGETPALEAADCARSLVLDWGRERESSPWVEDPLGRVYVGPDPAAAPSWVRSNLLPKVLQTS